MRIFPSIFLVDSPKKATSIGDGLFSLRDLYDGQFEYFEKRPLDIKLSQASSVEASDSAKEGESEKEGE